MRAGSSMVEQLTLNQRVAGSSPARLTNILKQLGVGFPQAHIVTEVKNEGTLCHFYPARA